MSFNTAKAKYEFIIKQAKTLSWRNYVSIIKSHTSIKSVGMKIKGKENISQVHLKKNTNLNSDPKEQANYLAESFARNYSSQNYSKSFQKIKNRKDTLFI